MPRKIQLFDSTLRDGNQALGVSFSVEDKILIAQKIDELGIHYIEGGWPNPSNQTDVEFFKRARKLKFKSKITAFGSTCRPENAAARDPIVRMILETETQAVAIFGKSWSLHVTDILRTRLEENLRMIADTVAYFKKHDREVIYDAEHFFDGYLENPEYALKTLEAANNAGADCLVLCDTNGGRLPMEVASILSAVRKRVKANSWGIHTHNDSGNAVANALMAVAEGAGHVQGTINGLGERCGNANLCTLIPNLVLKMDLACVTPKQLGRLREISLFVSEIANLLPDLRQPYVGDAAFSHKGGAHIDGVLKNQRSFEHIDPVHVGNERRYVLSDQAGRSTIVEKLQKMKPRLDKSDPVVRNLLQNIKDLEFKGYQFEAAEGSFQLLARRALGQYKEPFEFQGFRVIIQKDEDGYTHSEATIKVRKGTEVVHTAAEGDGPISALDNAVRKALVSFYPQIKDVRLEDFKVRVLDGRDGTSAAVRVLIESHDGTDHWGTIGVSSNIIEASWIALIDSLSYKLMKS